jgi:hypothetical protein
MSTEINQYNENNRPHGCWQEPVVLMKGSELYEQGYYDDGNRCGLWIQYYWIRETNDAEFDSIVFFDKGDREGEQIDYNYD